MRQVPLLPLAGVAALAGAALRASAVFPSLKIPAFSGEPLYFAIDVLLTLGLVGLFAGIPGFRSWVGAIGFTGALAGFELVRTGERLVGADAYLRSGVVLAFFLAIAGLALARGPGLARFAGVAWIASFGVGVAGLLLHWAPGAFFAGLLFCLGFGLGGLALVVNDTGRAARGR